jgi:hypothetical protein
MSELDNQIRKLQFQQRFVETLNRRDKIVYHVASDIV